MWPIRKLLPLFALLPLALIAAPEGDFARTLTPDEIHAAGLDKLSPAERLRLEALVQRYKAGESAGKAVASPEPKDGAVTKPTGRLPSWIGALVTLERTGNQPNKADAMESHLQGDFSGWAGRTAFKLENGQLWIQANSDSYSYAPTLRSPKIKIYPASFGTFWFEVEGVHQRCRVRPVKLE